MLVPSDVIKLEANGQGTLKATDVENGLRFLIFIFKASYNDGTPFSATFNHEMAIDITLEAQDSSFLLAVKPPSWTVSQKTFTYDTLILGPE